jgi:peptide deformylase
MIIYTLIMKKAYKLIHYGDPLLKTPSLPVAFPLSDSVDSAIDDCMNTLVSVTMATRWIA